ncbi:hypothetical protein ES288_D10G202600v1 [Gossypium darwinii]|uniref:Uncharacterized protein n=2 Tax=Gossypium TaxID=3633 RepID=A0A5D2J7K6_GOSTO|nr:hypothetical protein ES288_D10G202600v1 [Gossypium darwinii]TYH50415.1 hypothetical protein ES332_D10G204700v1 [Gossypium tomentosum]
MVPMFKHEMKGERGRNFDLSDQHLNIHKYIEQVYIFLGLYSVALFIFCLLCSGSLITCCRLSASLLASRARRTVANVL